MLYVRSATCYQHAIQVACILPAVSRELNFSFPCISDKENVKLRSAAVADVINAEDPANDKASLSEDEFFALVKEVRTLMEQASSPSSGKRKQYFPIYFIYNFASFAYGYVCVS